MGRVHGKCCRHCPSPSLDDDARDSGEAKEYNATKGKDSLPQMPLESIPIPSHNFNLLYSMLSQRGSYPDLPDKDNQDRYSIKTQLQGNPNIHFFGVFDGHGIFGAQCSNFIKERLVDMLSEDPNLLGDPETVYKCAFLRANMELHDSEIDDSMSGTTAITVLVVGNKLYVGNVGDSRAVLAVKDGNRILAKDLSYGQTPFRKDEYERVKLCGARVLSVDQVEGLEDPNIQTWEDEESEGGDPPRVWVQDGLYPGTAFTRSVGDSLAEEIGVTAEPEMTNSLSFA